MAEVRPVPSDTVRLLCTGQVVLSLAGACKELIENALDAKSKDIEIRAKNSGADSLEVSDQGTGIHPDNFESLGKAHQTSKLGCFEDLSQLHTYGFRGEAFSALCALSKVTVCTRFHTEAVAHRLEFDHDGNITSKSRCSRQVGTTVTVENLFENLPVRKKELLKNLNREYKKLLAVVQAYALICVGVRICLKKWPPM